MRKLVTILIALVSTAFTLSAYCQEIGSPPADIEAISAKWKQITKDNDPGVSMFSQPLRIELEVMLVKPHYACDREVLKLVARTMGLKIAVQPQYFCADFKTKDGTEVRTHLNGVSRAKLENEAPGQTLSVVTRFLAYVVDPDRTKNGFLVFVDDVKSR